MSKKPFAQSTVGKLLFGAATVINPTLGNVLNGVSAGGHTHTYRIPSTTLHYIIKT